MALDSNSATLKAALLGVTRDSAPFIVRDGAPEQTDIVIEWRLGEPRWQSIFAAANLARVTRLYVRLDESLRTARVFDEEFGVAWSAGVPVLTLALGAPLGPPSSGGVGFTELVGAITHDYRFLTSELRDPLAAIVNEHGWRLEGVVSKSSAQLAGAASSSALVVAPPTQIAPASFTPPPGSGVVVRGPNTIIQPRNGMATAGFVCALHGWIPFWIGFVMCVLAIIFSSVGMSRAKDLNGAGKGLAIAGLVIALCLVIPAMFGL